jgi:hypothetical protein
VREPTIVQDFQMRNTVEQRQDGGALLDEWSNRIHCGVEIIGLAGQHHHIERPLLSALFGGKGGDGNVRVVAKGWALDVQTALVQEELQPSRPDQK